VEFRVERSVFEISKLALTHKVPIMKEGVTFGSFESSDYNTTMRLLIAGECAARASSPQGIDAFNRTFEGWELDDRQVFVIRGPLLREWFGGFGSFQKVANLVGEFDLSMNNNPPVAMLFMYVEMFLD
jgi:hypothetical protein